MVNASDDMIGGLVGLTCVVRVQHCTGRPDPQHPKWEELGATGMLVLVVQMMIYDSCKCFSWVGVDTQ